MPFKIVSKHTKKYVGGYIVFTVRNIGFTRRSRPFVLLKATLLTTI